MDKKIFVLSGVSGVGKTTIANILKKDHGFKSSISYTTRKQRPNEKNGKDYRFISEKEFLKKIKNEFFLEYDEVFSNYYGTAKNDVENILKTNNIIFCLSTLGYKNLKKVLDTKVIGFYLLPPSKEELINRMEERNSSEKELQTRLTDIYEQSEQESKFFDHLIKPTSIEETLIYILKILNQN